MKKNKLYTVNEWNQPAFMLKNRFDWGGLAAADRRANPWNYVDDEDITQQYMNSKNAFGISKADNPFSKGNIKSTAAAVGTALAPTVGSLISDGYESGAGDAIGTVGSTVGNALKTVNPLLGTAVDFGSQFLKGLTNRAIGIKTNQAALNRANNSINTLNGFVSNAGSFDAVQGPEAVATEKVYEGGWFSGSKARRKNRALQERLNNAKSFAFRSVDNNINNLAEDQMNNALANYSAYGGPLDMLEDTTNMGAIEYGFMSDYLTEKRRQNELKNKLSGMATVPAFMPNSYAIGGDLQTNGADFSDGLTIISAGGTHESNPNEGVQLGVDSENVPNLVEEGETIFNDYVYSNRILADEATKQLFRLPKKKDITFAEISKKLEKEIAERPNDPISKSSFEKQMAELADEQERQKQEMEAERAKAAFEALTPEEQAAVMQEVSARQNIAAQEQAIAEQQAMQQPTPEEAAMMQQQQMLQADGSEAALGQEPQMNCFGGKINKFEEGGRKRNAGTWKKGTSSENWNTYTRGGLRDYLNSIIERVNNASSEEEKNKIRQEAIKTVGDIQQAYAKAYQSSLTPSQENEAVRTLQSLFQQANGNAYFGNISDNINLPAGHNTTDTEKGGYVDALWGPRTSIRNWGSTEYGDADYYKDLADLATQAGLVYAPNADWTYGDNQLYGLSMPAPVNNEGTTSTVTPTGRVFHAMDGDDYDGYIEGAFGPNVGAETRREVLPNGDTVIYHGRANASVGNEGVTAPGTKNDRVTPKHKAGWLRYAGLFGPAVGLGLQALGVGRPDTASLDAAISSSGDVNLADYQPIGNYLTYRPLDIWYQQNALNAQSRATDRALLNNSSPSRMSGLLANGYNSQIASGNLFRQAQEYNDALQKQVEEFNRGTNQFNAEAYNRNSQFNADAKNRARQYNAQLRLQAAREKIDADAGWYNGLYGNLSGLFKGISDIGRENEQFNWLSDLAADGAFGNLGTSNTGRRWTKEQKAKGGKIKKRGLTI